eukprot:GFUD01045058.1.p1 GENE.GFUD01045058.1~~GFUD01045058.1.p1  ORF type:complete len:329 (+),score=117.27 GFUD01045058.1:32-988(+)
MSVSPPSPSSQSISNKLKEKFPDLSVSLVSGSSSVLPPEAPLSLPTPAPQSLATDCNTLAEMFPLLQESVIQSALVQCNGQLAAALDLLLAKDLMDREVHHYGLYTRPRPICDLWVRGQCSGARAAACRDRHFYNDTDTDTRGAVSEEREVDRRSLNVFSSPYKARVIREQVKVLKEEVNLDSGKDEKWMEVEERELIDLTGDVIEDKPIDILELSSEDEVLKDTDEGLLVSKQGELKKKKQRKKIKLGKKTKRLGRKVKSEKGVEGKVKSERKLGGKVKSEKRVGRKVKSEKGVEGKVKSEKGVEGKGVEGKVKSEN